MLDWNDNEKYSNFGRNKHINRTVNLSDLNQPPRDQPTMAIKRSRNARKSSILGALVEKSQQYFETEFDQSKIRLDVISKKSMFK